MIRILPVILMLVIVATHGSCRKQPISQTSPIVNHDKLRIVWRSQIVPNPVLHYTISMNPVIYDDVVLFGTEYNLHDGQSPILFLDSSNGNVVDIYDDFINGGDAYDGEQTIVNKDYLVLRKSSAIDCVNLKLRQTQWQSMGINGVPKVYSYKNYLFVGVGYNSDKSCAILRSSVENLAWDTVYAFTRTDKHNPGFDSFGFGSLDNGDDVIVWKNRNWGAVGHVTDIFAFNLTADTSMWRNRDLDINSSVIPLKVADGTVFGLVRHRAFAIDLATGNLHWESNVNNMVNPTFSLEFVHGDLHIEENTIIVMDQSDELIGLDRSNGNVKWVRQNVGSGIEARFTYFEGKLFFPSGGLRIVDARNGESLISETLSEEIDDIKSKIVIDPNRRVMYFHNGREAFCVAIPKDI